MPQAASSVITARTAVRCSDCIHYKNSVHIDHNANIENVYNKLEEEVVEEYASPLKEMLNAV